MRAKLIFITGGVVSSVGKGIVSAGLAVLLQKHGYKVKIKKFDPYLNIDPGTMNPSQHGEVFVTHDGAETDLDLGHYERFTGVNSSRNDNYTSGRVYSMLLEKERKGEYLGQTVQVIPHVTNIIRDCMLDGAENYDFLICEIGGTIGDIEALPFYETIRQIGIYEKGNTMYLHVTLVPFLSSAGEVKTKPTQHSVKELRAIGIHPNMLICRCDNDLAQVERDKIALFSNLSSENVISAPNVRSIYEAPIVYHSSGLDKQVLEYFGLDYSEPDLSIWRTIVHNIFYPEKQIKIAIVGKYIQVLDSYKSLMESLAHGGIANRTKVEIKWVDARTFESLDELQDVDGIIVPGGFGADGIDGKILAIKWARENSVPCFGICYGMQLMVIEAARNLLHLEGASSTEIDPDTKYDVVGLMASWEKDGKIEKRHKDSNLGGTMRLGAYPAHLKKGSKISIIYGTDVITHERHRHRYEINNKYVEQLESVGYCFSGFSPDGVLPEVVEHLTHPWFIGVQYHPELVSRPFDPSPLFVSFVSAALAYSEKKVMKVV